MPEFLVHGTVKELEALNVPVDRYPSCSKRVMDGNDVVVKGCPFWRQCKCPEKATGEGPVNKGVRIIKKGVDGRTRLVNTVMTCYHIPTWPPMVEPRGGAVQIVANEGETMLLRGSRVVQEVIPGQGQGWKVEDFVENQVVPKFPRPGTGNNLADEFGRGKIIDDMRAELEQKRIEAAAGVKPEATSGPAESRKSK